MVACPLTTSPSTGIASPGRTTTASPTWTSPTGISTSSPFLTTRAVLGTSVVRCLMARRDRSVVKDSTKLPVCMKKTTTAAVGHCPTARAAMTPRLIRVWEMICQHIPENGCPGEEHQRPANRPRHHIGHSFKEPEPLTGHDDEQDHPNKEAKER